MEQVSFFALAALTLLGALGVVSARTVFVSALWLILSLLGVAGLYVLLQAGFLAAAQILIYVGAISVLILFAVMLTHHVMEAEEQMGRQWVYTMAMGVLLFGFLAALAYQADWPLAPGLIVPSDGGKVVLASGATAVGAAASAVPAGMSAEAAGQLTGVIETKEGETTVINVPGSIVMLGRAFMHEHLLAFELASIILLIALMGAIVMARE